MLGQIDPRLFVVPFELVITHSACPGTPVCHYRSIVPVRLIFRWSSSTP
jgi:hypothetical protein